jgi:molybdenum cofactor guanylyltransferase
MAAASELTLGILAGGAGRRFGGQDKGWIEVDGRPQVQRLLDAYRCEVGAVAISANRNLDRYRSLGAEVVSDAWPDYPGPLAGVVGLLDALRTPFLLTLPVDLVELPAGLPARLAAAACSGRPLVVEDDDGIQPMIACYPRELAAAAGEAFAAGERSVTRWQAALGREILRLPGLRFGNRNTPAGQGDS